MKSKEKLKCLLCISAMFNSKLELMIHFKKCHSKIRSLVCEICSCYFPVNCIYPFEISLLKKHWKVCHSDLPILQGLLSSDLDLYSGHKDTDNKIAREVNSLALKNFKRDDELVNRILLTLQLQKAKKRKDLLILNEKQKLQKDEIERVINEQKVCVPRTYPCSMCSVVMLSHTNLKKHTNECHEKEPQYKCKLCREVFWKQKELRRHKKIDHGIEEKVTWSMCTQCGKQIHLKAMKRHLLFVHSDKREFVCEVCGRGFKANQHLDLHMRRAHSDQQPFRCKVCFKTFKLAGSVREHLKKVHKMVNLPRYTDADPNYPVEKLY